MSGNRAQKGEAEGETKRGGVSRPQKSIGWEERAEIICAVRGQRAEQIGGGGDRARHRPGVQRQPRTELIIEKLEKGAKGGPGETTKEKRTEVNIDLNMMQSSNPWHVRRQPRTKGLKIPQCLKY